MKVFTGGIVTETNTFAPFMTDLEDWQTNDNKELSALGPLFNVVFDAASRRGYTVVPGFAALAEPAGKTTTRAYGYLKNRLIESLEDSMPVDFVVLILHGAMVAENCDDCEGDILEAVRQVVGTNIPIGVGLDTHAHLSSRMVDMADILVFMKEWPHIDTEQIIKDAFSITADMAEGRVSPVMSVRDCRMIAPYHTLTEPVKSIVDDMKLAEQKDGVLSVSFIHGFWYADVPDMGTKILVITDEQPRLGEELASEFVSRLFAIRGKTAPAYLSVPQMLDEIEAGDVHPVVVADVGDIPGGGAPGDATFILQGLLDRGVSNAALAFIWDPQSLGRAFAAGVGSELDLNIGGHACEKSGKPVDLRSIVCGTYSDLLVGEGKDASAVGDVAVVSSNGIYIGLARERFAAMSSDYFSAIGIDPCSMNVLVVKSANAFFAGFEAIAARTLYVDAGGVTGGQICDFHFSRVSRPMWPFVDEPFNS